MIDYDMIMVGGTFLGCALVVMLIGELVSGRSTHFRTRLSGLSGRRGAAAPPSHPVVQLTRTMLPKMGAPLAPRNEESQTRLKARLMNAGLYQRNALLAFLGVKMLLMVAPALIVGALIVTGFLPVMNGLLIALLASGVGLLVPSFWLDSRRNERQLQLRSALPNALDVMVICLEGGLGLESAFRRMTGELRTAHPLLAIEMDIVQKEIQLGRSLGEALMNFGERCDMDDVRSMAAVVSQTEKLGGNITRTFRVHADAYRQKHLQFAEEMAQKASTKILMPMILCIFPAIFVVVLGPAAIQVREMFARMK